MLHTKRRSHVNQFIRNTDTKKKIVASLRFYQNAVFVFFYSLQSGSKRCYSLRNVTVQVRKNMMTFYSQVLLVVTSFGDMYSALLIKELASYFNSV